jgi:hypothetical protein
MMDRRQYRKYRQQMDETRRRHRAVTMSDAQELNEYITQQQKGPAMDMNQVFPGNHLKATDLQGREVTVTIHEIVMEEVGSEQEEKPVVYFLGKQKGLVLNKTNNQTIMDLYGSESDNWIGQKIVLFPTQTDFGGKQVPCIRVKISAPQQQPSPQSTVQHGPKPAMQPITEADEIPF